MKTTLRVLALIAVLWLGLATAMPAWAGQGIGSSPYAADLLVSGLNTGSLDPGEEYWYAYSRLDLGDPAYNSVILSLNFEAAGRAVASRVNFQVFTFEQVDAWLKDTSGPVDSLGLGTPASADFDVSTGERLWAGTVAPHEVYYVRIFNLSPSPVTFRLTALGQKSAQMEAFMAFETAAPPREQAVIPAAINVPTQNAASSPAQTSLAALPIESDEAAPASTRWLLAAQAINGLPPQEAAAWLMSAAALGWLPAGHGSSALMPVDPNEDLSGMTGGDGGGDGNGGSAGQVVAVPVQPDPDKGDSIYPGQPLQLLDGSNIGRLGPQTEHWYTFTRGDLDNELIEGLSLTMFFTPGEPNIARHVTFEMFTGSQLQIWNRGTPEQMEHFGVGSWISRDGDYDTGERLWHGSVVDGDRYFVKITNDTNNWIDYHLITGDITNIEMGPKVTAVEVESPARFIAPQPPTGQDIGSPLPISLDGREGRLAAGEDIWFSFEHKTPNPDKSELEHYVIRLDHTPGAGFVTNHVNMEIYPFPEQHLWQRGDTNKIQPLGAGSDFEYDKAHDMHTWIWDGHLISNTIYFIRIRNDSPRAIDYDLSIERRRP
ncbi:MAG: hypothetical protein AB1801_10350 [Chloroflexota bacterium]